MIKVTPHITTIGDEQFKKFLLQKFKIDMLYPVFGDNSVDTLFTDWRGKDMLSWHRFTNGDDIVLEFYPENYIIKGGGKKMAYELSLPESINDFINDMRRFGVQLYWSTWIDENFEPKQYLQQDEIEIYYRELLGKMDKSQELL